MPNTSDYQKQVFPVIATHTAVDVLLSELLGKESNGYINPFGKRFEAILKLPRTVRLEYLNATPVTTHAYNVWGTTTLWPVIVACSDYTHPHEIPNGTIIMLPESRLMLNILKEENPNSIANTIITF
tara:strand:+ start:210 stop:590 length:381 start_codon:yes stop_codon:yes gene_type:complete